ncbi:MAG: hypothetical protein LBR83_05200 [Clostridiales bacterium]|jgi:hypothetical protein|nr:hypothetical protein [Clostridiales bacterium]
MNRVKTRTRGYETRTALGARFMRGFREAKIQKRSERPHERIFCRGKKSTVVPERYRRRKAPFPRSGKRETVSSINITSTQL